MWSVVGQGLIWALGVVDSVVILIGSKALTMGPLVCIIIVMMAMVLQMFLFVLVVGVVLLGMLALGKGVVKCFLCCHVLLQFEQGIVITCNVLSIVDEGVLPFNRHHFEVDILEVLMGEGW